ncbi:4-1-CTD domain-containing protein [Aphelenchoides besseyi]|nr:4-1-CTD domain-containing protein [Aphelenchoides besseyi]
MFNWLAFCFYYELSITSSSLMLNALVILLCVYKLSDTMRTYRVMLLFSAIIDSIFALSSGIAQTILVDQGKRMIFVLQSPFLPPNYQSARVAVTVLTLSVHGIKTVNNEQIKHTVQKQTYQTFVVDDTQTEQPSAKNNLERLIQSVIPITSIIPTDLHSERARTYVLVYGKDAERPPRNDEQFGEDSYKTLRNGKVHTTLEHRITINGPEAIHASELKIAISEATATNPNFEVVSVEIKEERLP